jgi:hypothetical protein
MNRVNTYKFLRVKADRLNPSLSTISISKMLRKGGNIFLQNIYYAFLI